MENQKSFATNVTDNVYHYSSMVTIPISSFRKYYQTYGLSLKEICQLRKSFY